MQITAGLFADVEAAYRLERIRASFEDHAHSRGLRLFRRAHAAADQPTATHTLRTA
jgi:hypothetical protein